MLNRLRVQFVMAATAALLMALCLVMAPVYFLVSGALTGQMEILLDLVLDNDGNMPTHHKPEDEDGLFRITQEQQYEMRYFTVEFDTEGNVVETNTQEVFSVDEEDAEEMARKLYDMRGTSGRMMRGESVYLFKSRVSESGMMVAFVDCTSRYWIIHQVLYYMFVVGLIILLIFSITLAFLSKRIVEPFIENTERQKRFITNASHELKTPLAVISANTEMQEIESGKSKWTDSTMRQVKRLNALVSELVTLSKLDEKDEITLSEVDASRIVKEQSDNFEQVVLQQGKKFEQDITPELRIMAEPRSVQELTSILLDNAAKYCDDGGTVQVKLLGKGNGRSARLYVTNSYVAGEGVDYRRFFDRFYREDESHNSKKAGFGIGLSIAQEIAKRLGAKIQVAYKNKEITFAILFK